MPTSSTITSGGRVAIRCLGLGGAPGLVDVHVDVLEGRSEQRAEPRIVVYQQQAHRFPPDRMPRTPGIGRVGLKT